MKKAQIVFSLLGTFLLLYSVIAYEPPAFIAYIFGAVTGACWLGNFFLWWLREDGGEHDD